MQRKFRLRQRADFEQLRHQGQRFAHPIALLIICRQDSISTLDGESGNSRFAFSAGRHIGNAVRRNRAKRLLREALRPHLAHVQPHWNCLFVARAQATIAPLAEVEAAVCQLLSRAQLFRSGAPACQLIEEKE